MSDETVSSIAVADWRDVDAKDKASVVRILRQAAMRRSATRVQLSDALRTAANLLERIL